MPSSYGVGDAARGFEPIEWSWAAERLRESRSYWIATSRADGRPHLTPVWGVWADCGFHFFTDPNSLKAANIRRDPRVVVHLESGDDVVILEGELVSRAASRQVVDAYEAKYGIALGDLSGAAAYSLNVSKALAWLESDFPRTATRWRRREGGGA